ncbi:MAG: FtsQ-type POTRA domain-containing protein [Chitinophagaceae bacterium]|nr:MAG: FtsQ-type POTRA domain-containing protein [Chitinophagaceae bacterium]
MRFKRPIYRYLFFAAWIVVLGGITTLVIAANGKSQAQTCKGVEVSINGDGDKIYVEKDDVLNDIKKTAKGSVVNKQFGAINLGELERSLEKNPWIRDAELYFDTKDVLHVSVFEREPIARVFNTAGNTFYIDSAGYQLPLLETYSAKLPVVTGFTAAKKLTGRDSITLKSIKNIVRVVSEDAFWNAQVGQIDITPEGKFELVPVIGSHIIKLGYADNVEQKLQNLMVFYKQVLPKAGLAKYSALDVQFDGQVVAVKKGPTNKVDSIQLQKNIEELMKKKEAEQEPDDNTEAVAPIAASVKDTVVSETPKSMVATVKTKPDQSKPNPTPKRTTVQKSNPTKPTTQQKRSNVQSKPKAVMPKKGNNEY